jgi:hypothetical protein
MKEGEGVKDGQRRRVKKNEDIPGPAGTGGGAGVEEEGGSMVATKSMGALRTGKSCPPFLLDLK